MRFSKNSIDTFYRVATFICVYVAFFQLKFRNYKITYASLFYSPILQTVLAISKLKQCWSSLKCTSFTRAVVTTTTSLLKRTTKIEFHVAGSDSSMTTLKGSATFLELILQHSQKWIRKFLFEGHLEISHRGVDESSQVAHKSIMNACAKQTGIMQCFWLMWPIIT